MSEFKVGQEVVYFTGPQGEERVATIKNINKDGTATLRRDWLVFVADIKLLKERVES